jgi:hypothetical protein
MDFFREARWFFHEDDKVSWYQEVAKKIVVAPRIPRYGILTTECSNNLASSTSNRTECNTLVADRMATDNPLILFADIGNLENNDECKMCIEDKVESLTQKLLVDIRDMFTLLRNELNMTNHTLLTETIDTILSKLSLQAANDYYTYTTIRNLYGLLGGPTYVESYKDFYLTCTTLSAGSIWKCGPAEITLEEAEDTLRKHADHSFSSISTAGTALPFWGDDGEGFLLEVRLSFQILF